MTTRSIRPATAGSVGRLDAAQRRYRRTETLVAAVISAVLSIGFVWLVFGGVAIVPVGSLVIDALPQTFMIALMSSFMPTLLTRRRMTRGIVAPTPVAPMRPRHPLIRSLTIAAAVTLVSWALHAAFLPLSGAALPFDTVMIGKAVFGAALGAVVARVAVTMALRD